MESPKKRNNLRFRTNNMEALSSDLTIYIGRENMWEKLLYVKTTV